MALFPLKDLLDGTRKLSVQLTGSYLQDGQAMFVRGSTKNEIETIINAQTVSASGNTGWVTVDTKGASKIVLLINCDMPWKLEIAHPWSTGAEAKKEHQYPDYNSTSQAPATLLNYPRFTVIGLRIDSATSIADALDKAIVFSPLFIKVINQDTSNIATVTVRVMRIWR